MGVGFGCAVCLWRNAGDDRNSNVGQEKCWSFVVFLTVVIEANRLPQCRTGMCID